MGRYKDNLERRGKNMKETLNYKLKKPEQNDYVNIEDLNYNVDIIDEKIKETESQLADMVKKEQIYGNKTEIVGMNVSGEYSSYGSYGIIFKSKQTINLKTVDIDTNKTQTVKVALTEWYDDLSKEIKEGEALFTKELSLKQGLNKYTLDFLIPNDGKTYFLYTIGQMEDTKRRDFAPPINAYIDFIKGGRAVPDDSTKKRQVINKWYWFFNWDIETSIEQNLNKLFTFADNGKKDWVDIVGSPLLNTDSFSTLKSKTQTLKNTFASNLKDKKINASGTESLDNLINKIKNINVGKKWASGTTLNSSSLCTISNLDFKPSTIIWCINYYESSRTYMNYISVLINNTISFNALESDSWSTKMSTNTTISTSSDGFSVNATYPHYNKKTIWYAFE
ncbi:hypothetical protein DP124_12095 [Clostridium tetani]|nr:hypothetical protein DP124_12095 [Clostridium tetani]